MKEIEFIAQVEAGKIVINVPNELDGKKLRVSVTEVISDEVNEEKWRLLPGSKKLEILEKFKGTATFPEVEINKYEVYDQ